MTARVTPWATLRRWPIGALLLPLPLLLVAAVPAARADHPGLESSPADPTERLYVSLDPAQHPFVALDPATLADAQGVAPLDPSDGVERWSKRSDDGSTFVVANLGRDMLDVPAGRGSYRVLSQASVTVRDGPGGPERVAIAPSLFLWDMWLSGDGSRLVVAAVPASAVDTPVLDRVLEWSVYDTGDGRRLNTRRVAEPAGWRQVVVDAAAGRLYALTAPEMEDATGPSPVTLVAHDLLAAGTTGEIGRLALPGVLAGWWQTDRPAPNGDYRMGAHLEPGVALSPDGRRLAVVHADAEAVTLVDTASLTVARTATLVRPTRLVDRLVAWLPLVPHGAAAKGSEGTTRWAVFDRNGRHLYVWGSETALEGETLTVSDSDLRVIDPATGKILGEAPMSGQILDVLPSLDGRALYVSAYDEVREKGVETVTGVTLRRLDAASLDVLAERTFAGAEWLGMVLRPSAEPG